MKRNHVAVILVCCTISTVFAGTYSGGLGTQSQPYEISCPNDLLEIGNNSADFDSYFILVNDINMAGITTFVPIGYYSTTSLTSAVPFTGSFDGQGFSISNLSLTSAKPGIGLFGIVDANDAVIKNITVINPVFTTTSSNGRIGGLVGFFDGDIIENCHIINPTITGGPDTGGLIGTTWYNYSPQISYCSVQGGTISGKNRLGGFAGYVANNHNTVFRCWASAQVSCYGTSLSTATYVGGFAGGANYDGTVISQCFALGNVTGGASYCDRIGGFIGSNSANIDNCFARGNVSGRNYVGGFSGYHGHNGSPTRVQNCYSTGKPTGTGTYVGGFTGNLFTYTADCNYCYWDTNTSETTTSAEGLPRTTTQMYDQSNFTNWNFASIWFMPQADYPKLRFVFNAVDFDCNGSVNFLDFAVFANAWNADEGAANYNIICDLQSPPDGTVNVFDLAIFVTHWLAN